MSGESSEERESLGKGGLSLEVTACLYEYFPLPRHPRWGFSKGRGCGT